MSHVVVTSWSETKYLKSVCVPPIREAVCSADHQARRDERASTEKASATFKDSGDPRLWLYRCERAPHDFVLLVVGPLATRQLCKHTQEVSVSNGEERVTFRRKQMVWKLLRYLYPQHGEHRELLNLMWDLQNRDHYMNITDYVSEYCFNCQC